jgi:hypothetical protein
MDDHVIDCCSLLNLFMGWRGLTELRALGGRWHICDAVLGEAEYTREYGPDGSLLLVPMDAKELVRSGFLLAARPESEQELEDFVAFATEVDDGEAQALAIAKNRRYVLLTDDRKAAAVARRADVGIAVISTAAVLQVWARRDRDNEARLRDVIGRISTLARFSPRAGDEDYDWWRSHLASAE